MQSLGPRPYPGEDTATTRDSDEYLEKNGLGTREAASPGELSPTGSVNELLKQVPTDNNVSSDELIAFLGSKKELWGGENFALLLAKKLYSLNKREIELSNKIKTAKETFDKTQTELDKKIVDSQTELDKKILDSQSELNKKIVELEDAFSSTKESQEEAIKGFESFKTSTEEKLSRFEIGISSAHTKEVILRRETFEKIDQLNVDVTENSGNLRNSINYVEEKADKTLGEVEEQRRSCDALRGSLRKMREECIEDIDRLKNSVTLYEQSLSSDKSGITEGDRETFGEEMCDFVLRATSRIQGIDSLKSSLQKELDTLKLQAREHARYISSLENANEKLETTIKSLRAQISALQKELIKPKGVEDKVNADVKKEKSSSVWIALFFCVLAVFIFIGLRLQEVPSQQTRSLPAPARIQDSAKEAAQSKIISTFNLPVNFDGGLSWYRSYFSDYDDKQIINYLKYQQLKKKQISFKRLNKKQKDLITYFCEAPHFEALLTKGYRFQCVLEDMEKKILRSFPITKQDCQ